MATQPLSSRPDISTQTFSDLDAVLTPPLSCGKPEFTDLSWSKGVDHVRPITISSRVITSTVGTLKSNQAIYTSFDSSSYIVKGRNPPCLPPNYPNKTCIYNAGSSTTLSGIDYIYSPARCPEHYVTVDRSIDNQNTDMTGAIYCPE